MRQPQENGKLKEKSLADINLKRFKVGKRLITEKRRQKIRPQYNSPVTIK